MLFVIIIVSGEFAQSYTNNINEVVCVKLETAMIVPVIVIVKLPTCVED